MKIEFKPHRKLIIHGYAKYELQDFLRFHTANIPPESTADAAYWAEGVIFSYAPLPSTDDIVREELRGRLHWSDLAFAFMEEFQPKLVVEESGITVPVVNVSSDPLYRAAARWMKARSAEAG